MAFQYIESVFIELDKIIIFVGIHPCSQSPGYFFIFFIFTFLLKMYISSESKTSK